MTQHGPYGRAEPPIPAVGGEPNWELCRFGGPAHPFGREPGSNPTIGPGVVGFVKTGPGEAARARHPGQASEPTAGPTAR